MKATGICLLPLLLTGPGTALMAGDEDLVERNKVRTVIIECDGEDCADTHGSWVVNTDDCRDRENCEVDVMVGRYVSDQESIECAGDDCDRQVYVFKTGEAPIAWAAGDHDFHFYTGSRGFLGVQFLPLTAELSEHFNSGSDGGVMVSKVVDDSPAALAGLQVGDIIVSVNDERLGHGGLVRALSGKKEGDEVALGVVRNGRSFSLTTVLEERQGQAIAPAIPHAPGHRLIKIAETDGVPFPEVPHFDFDTDGLCDGLEECEVRVECGDGSECTCEVNGESVDCP